MVFREVVMSAQPSTSVYTSSTSASLSPVSPLDNIFALPAEVLILVVPRHRLSSHGRRAFSVTVLRYGTGYQTV